MPRTSRFPADSPSTPNVKGKGSVFSQAPSTTPAGPPPSWLTNKSTTPAGPPPTLGKLFGSSYTASNNTFARKANPRPFSGRQTFAVPASSPPQSDEDEDADAEGEEVDMEDDFMKEAHADPTLNSVLDGSMGSPRGFKRSRNGDVRAQGNSDVSAIARQIATQGGLAQLHGLDDVVLQTEAIIGELSEKMHDCARGSQEGLLSEAVARLDKAWSASTNVKTKQGGIGPVSEEPFVLANYIASLLLQLHHPHSKDSIKQNTATRPQNTVSLAKQKQNPRIAPAKALLDWLNTYHNPFPDDFNAVHLFRPAPSASDGFWDVIYIEVMHGRIPRAIRLLKDAKWEHAITALDDGFVNKGYEGKQLDNIEVVVDDCINLLENCPAVRNDNWDVTGGEWQLFRQRVRKVTEDLDAFAEGGEDELDSPAASRANVFDHEDRGSLSMSRSTRRAESRVPYTIYQNLKVLYRQLLGEPSFLVEVCQDWLEASILMTVWWNGDETKADFNVSLNQSLRKSMRAGTREVDITPMLAYRRHLYIMLDEVQAQDDACFHPDTMQSAQVGLMCVMDDDVESVVALLRSWDQTVAAAVVEIASLGAWLPQARSSGQALLQQGFSSEDLMVLSHGPGHETSQIASNIDKDEVLKTYAEVLASHDVFQSNDKRTKTEGWQLAVSVLGRLDDSNASKESIAETLQQIELSDEVRLDKILSVCGTIGLGDQGRVIAERYADSLAESSVSYGSALILYARAHATAKLKNTLALLITLCLIESAATPPESQLDSQLASLLSNERTALINLARADTDAAKLLSNHLSGYAMVRRFYTLRDQALTPSAPLNTRLAPLERKRQAATSLIAVIESASDCIRGGLFDPAVESAIPVDSLLCLLGEALPLLGQPKRIFTQQQVFSLLRIVEDLDTAPGRIRENATSLLQASMSTYRGEPQSTISSTSSSGVLVRKPNSDLISISSSGNLLGGSSYELLATSMMLRSQGQGVANENGSASASALAPVQQRAWDWRKGIDAVADSPRIQSGLVLGLLRTALAQEVARGWAGVVLW